MRRFERFGACIALAVGLFLYGGLLYGYVFDYEATVAQGHATQMRLKAWSDFTHGREPAGSSVPEWLFWTGLIGAPVGTAAALWRWGR